MLKKNIYLMYAIALLQGMVFYGPIATLYRLAQGITVFQITLIESISLALCLVLELPWGIIADRIGYQRTMLVCCLLFFISKIIFWQATNFAGFLLERLVLSVVISGLSGVDISILYLSSTKETSQQVFGTYNSLSTVGLLVAAFVFSVFIREDHMLAALCTVISYGTAAILALFLTEVKDTARCKSHAAKNEWMNALKAVWGNKYLLLFLIGVALLNETHQTLTVYFNQLQYAKMRMPQFFIGAAYVLVTLAGLVSSLSSKVTQRIGAAKLMAGCYLFATSCCVLLAITSSAVVSVGCMITLRISFSLFQPLQSKLQNLQVATENRATALSLFAVIINAIGVGTNVVFGALADRNLCYAFIAGAVLCLFGFIGLKIWSRGTENKFLV